MRIDEFCRCLRELIPEYEILEEGAEKHSFGRIKDLV